MRSITVKIGLVAVLLMLSRYSIGQAAPQQTQAPDIKTMSATELEKAGDQARAQKDYPEAIRYLEAAVKKNPKNSVLLNKLGLTELKNNDLKHASYYFEKAAKRDSKNADAINNLGAVYYMQKNFGAAAKYFKKAVALEETRPTFHINLGAAWFSQKKTERAVTEYARALELDPMALQNPGKVGVTAQIASPEERAQFSYMMAKIYAKRGDTEDCLQCLRKAKEDGYRNLTNVYRDEEFAKMRDNPRLHEVVPPPVEK